MNELLVATNPDLDSRLGYLLRLPLDGGMVFRTSGTWPRTTALYCYPVSVDEWPEEPEIVERVALRVGAENRDTVTDQGVQAQRTDLTGTVPQPAQHDLPLWPSDSRTCCSPAC